MKKELMLECRLSDISGRELLVRGGTSWIEIKQFFLYLKKVIDFIGEYKEDITRGLERGWKFI
jgi:hypothetical protein